MELQQLHLIGDGEHPDHHGAHVTQDCPQNQALGRSIVFHPGSLGPPETSLPPPFVPTPDLLLLSMLGGGWHSRASLTPRESVVL
jgi:hypothetical protein